MLPRIIEIFQRAFSSREEVGIHNGDFVADFLVLLWIKFFDLLIELLVKNHLERTVDEGSADDTLPLLDNFRSTIFAENMSAWSLHRRNHDLQANRAAWIKVIVPLDIALFRGLLQKHKIFLLLLLLDLGHPLLSRSWLSLLLLTNFSNVFLLHNYS